MAPDWKPEIRRRIAVLNLEPTREAAIIAELAQHLDDCFSDALAGGASHSTALQKALAELSSGQFLTRELRRVERVRRLEPIVLGTRQRSSMIADIWQDVRYGVRMLRKQPGFAAVAILTLALGIGANTAIFSMINSVLIKALPYPHPESLVNVWETLPNGNSNSASAAVFKDWRAYASDVGQFALMKGARMNLTGTGNPEQLPTMLVSTEFLPVLGIAPLLGRGFAPGEDLQGGNNKVAILSYSFWQRNFAGNTNVIGQTISLNQSTYTIVGVLPAGAMPQDEWRIFVPIIVDVDTDTVKWNRGYHCCGVMARLNPGVSVPDAQSRLGALKQRMIADYPPFKKDWNVKVISLQTDLTGNVKPTLMILLGTVGLVLLIACANVSNLLLARSNGRSREMAVRVALGADSWRIVRQLLIESLLLALIGCGFGILVAMGGIRLLANMAKGQIPQMLSPTLDVNVMLFSVALACGCGILFGIFPALRASRPDLNHVLKDTERGAMSSSRRRSQSMLVIAEFALTSVLLVGAGLFLRSFVRTLETDPGFNPKNTIAFDVSFSRAKYPTSETQQQLLQTVTQRIATLPGVESVGATTALPLSNVGRGGSVSRPDKPNLGSYGIQDEFVVGDYFAALQIRLLRGRTITETDNIPNAPPVMVIDAKVARDLFPDEEPIGRTLTYGPKTWEIVGVVSQVHHGDLISDPRPRVFGSRVHFSYPNSSIIIRSSQAPASIVEGARRAVLEADPDQPIANVRTLEEALQRSVARQRTTLILLGIFALLAISLACIGIYGVMSYSIGQRARELSIRSALGARRLDIVRLVFSGGMKLSAIGVGIGLAASLGLARLVQSLLYQVKTYDPLVFISSAVLLGLVAALSIYLPARRASRLDPIAALRSE